jgi:hypothetical protein
MMRWAALPITDRRWAAPLSAVALGFGLFVGVAIGPGATGTFATGATQVVEIPGFGGAAEGGGGEEAGSGLAGGGSGLEPSGGEAGASLTEESTFAEAQPTFTPPQGGESPKRAQEPPDAGAEPAPQEPEPEAPQLAGVVVHVNSAAGSYTVAEEGGIMSAVHAGKLPAPGAKVEVPIETLANGTLAEAGKRSSSGTNKRASLAGIVTFVDPTPTAPAYAVSNRGASVLVHIHPDPSGAPPILPVLGAYAAVGVDVESPPPPMPVPVPAPTAPACAPDPTKSIPNPIQSRGVVWQRTLSAAGTPYTHSDFEGIVAAVCAETGQLLISADDLRESGHDLLLTAPPAIDLAKVEIGESIAAAADIGADGAFTLTGLASDEHSKGADDEGAAQGDLVPTKSDKGASR